MKITKRKWKALRKQAKATADVVKLLVNSVGGLDSNYPHTVRGHLNRHTAQIGNLQDSKASVENRVQMLEAGHIQDRDLRSIPDRLDDGLGELDKRLADLENRIVPDGRERLERLEAQAHDPKDVTDAIDGLRGGQDALMDRLAALEKAGHPVDVGIDPAGDDPRVVQLQSDLSGYKQLNEDIAGERDILARKLRERTQERDEARAKLADANGNWRDCASAVDDLERKLADERGRCANLAESVTKLQRTLDSVAKTRDGLREENGVLTAERDDAQDATLKAQAAASAATRRIAEMEAALLAVKAAGNIGTAHSLARACLGLVKGDDDELA